MVLKSVWIIVRNGLKEDVEKRDAKVWSFESKEDIIICCQTHK